MSNSGNVADLVQVKVFLSNETRTHIVDKSDLGDLRNAYADQYREPQSSFGTEAELPGTLVKITARPIRKDSVIRPKWWTEAIFGWNFDIDYLEKLVWAHRYFVHVFDQAYSRGGELRRHVHICIDDCAQLEAVRRTAYKTIEDAQKDFFIARKEATCGIGHCCAEQIKMWL
jgi:hypothetical protein